jgi:DNA-directed RNA polymerase specialized sigma24 family protein
MAQTFLSPAQVDELVALYCEGLSVAELGRRFGIYSRTAAAHLVRRSVPLRQRGVATTDVPEAVRLYEGGLTLVEVGLRFGVSQGAVRTAIAAEGAEIRPRGRRPQLSA